MRLLRVQWLLAVCTGLLLLVGAPPLSVLSQSSAPPPFPRAPWGVSPSRVWGATGGLSAASKPLNQGNGAAPPPCNRESIDPLYYFHVWENYQQIITFFPIHCTNLGVQINAVPASRGTLYQYSASLGRSYPITAAMLPFNLTSNMLLFQPPLNDFSVCDDASLSPARNSSLATLVFQLWDTNAAASGSEPLLPATVADPAALAPLDVPGAQVQFWVVWTNQAPSTPNQLLSLHTLMESWDNQVMNLTVRDADVDAGIAQMLTAYVVSLPRGADCKDAQLYQYDETAAPLYRGEPITLPQTPVLDGWPSFRVVLSIGGTGRPYCSFNYSADDYYVDSVLNGVVTVNILVQETPQSAPLNVSVSQNGQVKFQLPALSSNTTAALNRALIASMPSRGSLFQVLPDGSVGQRVQVVPSAVTDPGRSVFFKPEPYTTSDGLPYAQFSYWVDNGLAASNQSTVVLSVHTVHLAPMADPVPVLSPTGNDAAVLFRMRTMQPGSPPLSAVIVTYPRLGTLKQNDAVGTLMTNLTCSLPCNVTDLTVPQVIYSPQQNLADPSQNKRYTETFSYAVFDGTLYSEPASVTVQVGSRIKPPLVFSQRFTTSQIGVLLIQLNGTVQDAGDTWAPLITSLPEKGQLFQMHNAQQGSAITVAPAAVIDPNYYVYFVPDRFSPEVVSFEFEGQNSESMKSPTRANVTITVTPVGYAPVVAESTVSTPASQAVVIHLPYSAGPAPPPTAVFVSEVPAAGSLYQWNSTTGQLGALITASDLAAARAASLPGVLVTDPLLHVQYDPPPYVHGPALLGYAFAKLSYVALSQTVNGPLLSPAPAPVTIAVTQVNFPAIASDAWLSTPQETGLSISLSDFVVNPSAQDGNTFVCKISSMPQRGSLYQVDAQGRASTMIPAPDIVVSDPAYRVIYRPREGFGAPYDSFNFFAVDPVHLINSRFATVRVNVTFVNKPPRASNIDARLHENQAKVVTLPCQDPEGLNCTFYIVDVNLPRGQLFQFEADGSGGGEVVKQLAARHNLTFGGVADVDPEAGGGWTLANYTGEFGGGFDHLPYAGAPITSWPVRVKDPLGRVLFAPVEYTRGSTAYDSLYGNPFLPGQGTFSYLSSDGTDNSTTPGAVSVRVRGVPYAPLVFDAELTVAEDGFVVIELPVRSYDTEESPLLFIMAVPTSGALYQYDGRTPLSPKAEQILSLQTHVQDFIADGSTGTGRTVVYEPPKLRHGMFFTNFTFRAENSKQSRVATITIHVSKTNHAPIAPSFSVILSGHNSTVPVLFNVTEVDYQAVHLNITSFPAQGALWTGASFHRDTSPSGFHTYRPTPGSRLAPPPAGTAGAVAAPGALSSMYYPPAPYYNSTNATRIQTFTILFDDFNMGGRAVPTGCVVPGSDVSCGYTSFNYRVIDVEGAYAEGFVQVLIQCGPSYVINTWQSVGSACVTCPTGAICPTEGQFTPLAQPGYWRGITPTGLMFVQCNPTDACLGTWNQSALVTDLDMQCASGYHGRLCAACMDGYYKLNDECKSCPTTSVFWLVLGGVPVIILLMFAMLHVSRRGIDLTFFAVVLTYAQILSVYSQYHLTWPESVMTTLTVFSITHLNLDIFAVSCYYDTGDYSDKWKAKMAVVPGLALGVLAMVGLLVFLRAYCAECLNAVDVSRYLAKKDGRGKAKGKKNVGDDDVLLVDPRAAAIAAAAAAFALPSNSSPKAGDKASGVGGVGLPASSGLANHQRGLLNQAHALDLAAAVDARVFLNNDPSAGFDDSTPLAVWIRYYISLGFRTFTLLLFVAYLPITVKAFQLYCCTHFPDGTETFDADRSLICYDDWWYTLNPWGIVAVIVYGAGIPAWFVFALYKTHPPFDWVKYWGPLYYPRIRTGPDAFATRKAASARRAAAAKLGAREAEEVEMSPTATSKSKASSDLNKKLPPPPPGLPPRVPAPPLDKADERDSAVSTPVAASATGAAPVSRPLSALKFGNGGGVDNGNGISPRKGGPHLHAATVHALEQARAGSSAQDVAARKAAAALDDDSDSSRARQQAAWSQSENLALTSATHALLNRDEKISRFTFTLVIDPFRDDMFFWMLVILFRSFLLAMVSIFFADEPVYQATLALLVLFLYTLGTAYFQPYVNPSMNKLEFLTMSCACLVLFSGFLFVGESNKTDVVFDLLAAICLCIIGVSFVAIVRVVFHKMEEAFHCYNCRRVPNIDVPTYQHFNSVAKQLRKEIRAGHAQGALATLKATDKNKLMSAGGGAGTGTTSGSSAGTGASTGASVGPGTMTATGSGGGGGAGGLMSPSQVRITSQGSGLGTGMGLASPPGPSREVSKRATSSVAPPSARVSARTSAGGGGGMTMMVPQTLALSPMSIGSPSKQTRTLLSGASARRSDDDRLLSSPSAAVGSPSPVGAGPAAAAAAEDATHFKISAAGDHDPVGQAGAHSQAYDLASPSNIMTP